MSFGTFLGGFVDARNLKLNKKLSFFDDSVIGALELFFEFSIAFFIDSSLLLFIQWACEWI